MKKLWLLALLALAACREPQVAQRVTMKITTDTVWVVRTYNGYTTTVATPIQPGDTVQVLR